MPKPDRQGYARRNAVVLACVFAGFIILGLMRENVAALAGGAAGLAWVGSAVFFARDGS